MIEVKVNTNPLDRNIQFFPKVGPMIARKLEKLGIIKIHDLLFHLPSRYIDFSKTTPLANRKIGETVSASGFMAQIKNIYTKNGKQLTEGVISDETGEARIIWFNQYFLTRVLKPGMKVSIAC